MVLSPFIFHILPRYAFFSTSSLHCTFVSGFFSFCLQVFIETLLTQVGRVCFITFIQHHRRQLPIAEGLVAALVVTTKQRVLAEHSPRLGTKVLSSFYAAKPSEPAFLIMLGPRISRSFAAMSVSTFRADAQSDTSVLHELHPLEPRGRRHTLMEDD